MGIVSDSEFDSELSNVSVHTPKSIPPQSVPSEFIPTGTESVPTGQIVDIQSPGRKEGDLNVPETLRKLIGETSVIEGRSAALKLGEAFGVSPSSVSAYAVGATSTATYHEPDNDLKNYIDGRKRRLSKKALQRLNLAINHITEGKLADAKLGEIVGVATAMSQVVKNLAPPEPKQAPVTVENKPVFMLYAPATKKEEAYDVIHSRE
jgi:hypothetical protein